MLTFCKHASGVALDGLDPAARRKADKRPIAIEPEVSDPLVASPSSIASRILSRFPPRICPRPHTSSGGHPASHRELTLASLLELSLRLGIGLGPLAPRRPLRSLLASPLPLIPAPLR